MTDDRQERMAAWLAANHTRQTWDILRGLANGWPDATITEIMDAWLRMNEIALEQFQTATAAAKQQIRERLTGEAKIAPLWNPETVIEWMLTDPATYTSASEWLKAAQQKFPGITITEWHQAAAYLGHALEATKAPPKVQKGKP